MNTLHDLIEAHDGPDPAQVAADVLDALSVPAKWRALFYPLVRDECRRLRRRATVAAFTGSGGGHDPHENHERHASSRPAFLAAHVCCGGDIGFVRLGAMTVADHEARIAYQASFRAGIDRDIERHLSWIDQIKNTPGASCLDDVYSAEEAAA